METSERKASEPSWQSHLSCPLYVLLCTWTISGQVLRGATLQENWQGDSECLQWSPEWVQYPRFLSRSSYQDGEVAILGEARCLTSIKTIDIIRHNHRQLCHMQLLLLKEWDILFHKMTKDILADEFPGIKHRLPGWKGTIWGCGNNHSEWMRSVLLSLELMDHGKKTWRETKPGIEFLSRSAWVNTKSFDAWEK